MTIDGFEDIILYSDLNYEIKNFSSFTFNCIKSPKFHLKLHTLALRGLANSRFDIYVVTHSTFSLLHAKRFERLTSINREPRSVCWSSNDYISFIEISSSEMLVSQKYFMYGWVWLSGEIWAFQSLLYNLEEKNCWLYSHKWNR